MALAALRPALFAVMLASLSGGCTSSPASDDDVVASTDAQASTRTPERTPAPDPTPSSKADMDTSTDMIANGQSFAMQPGGQATLSDGSALRYVGVREDSRCPPDRQCIWAGDAVVAFEWAGTEVILHTGIEPRSHVRDGLSLALVSLARGEAPEAQLLVDAAK